jgi:hypothetical protein
VGLLYYGYGICYGYGNLSGHRLQSEQRNVRSRPPTLTLRLFPRIVKPSNDDLTPRLPAQLFRTRLDLRGEQHQSRSSLHRIHCSDVVSFQPGVRVHEARSLILPGTAKSVNRALSGITALGKTKAPIEISGLDGLVRGRRPLRGAAREARTTLAKWVGTDTAGVFPMTS